MFVVNVTAAVDVPQQQQQEDQTKPDPQATEKKSHQVEQGLPWKDLEDSSNHPKFGTDQPPDAQVNRIERAIRGMREAGRRLSQSDASQATRDVQRQVLRDLDELIRSARQQRMSQQQQQRDNSTPRQQPQRRPKGEQQEQRPASDASAPATRPQQTKDKTLESEERLTKSANERAKLANRRRLAAEVWGHLPDRVRERLLQHYDVNYLPRYEELVRRYFEALAETNNRQNSR
jgi:hypothetical protein